MSDPTYLRREKELIWLAHEGIKTPPFSAAARIEAGTLLRRLQRGENIGMPHSRPMPSIANHTHELRIPDQDATWRIFYTIHRLGIVILEIIDKDTNKTPRSTIEVCQKRLKQFLSAIK